MSWRRGGWRNGAFSGTVVTLSRETGHRNVHGSDPVMSARPSPLGAERGHRQAAGFELLPVELGLLLVARPDPGPARVVDLRREPHPTVVVDSWDHARDRERHAFERVVVVVQDDHL